MGLRRRGFSWTWTWYGSWWAITITNKLYDRHLKDLQTSVEGDVTKFGEEWHATLPPAQKTWIFHALRGVVGRDARQEITPYSNEVEEENLRRYLLNANLPGRILFTGGSTCFKITNTGIGACYAVRIHRRVALDRYQKEPQYSSDLDILAGSIEKETFKEDENNMYDYTDLDSW